MSFLLCSILTFPAFSFNNDSYTTPDSWAQHVTTGKIVKSTEGTWLTEDTSLYTTLTTRLRLKSNEYAEDSDVYQYIRMHTDPVKLGDGIVKFSAYGRIATDINGNPDKDWTSSYYYNQQDILDAELDKNDPAGRLYQAYAQFDGVIRNTKLNAGRFYLEHLNTFQVDGGDLTVNAGKNFKVYAFGGLPVSYYYDFDNASVYGVGAQGAFAENTRIQAEYTAMDIDDIDDDYTQIRLIQAIPNGSVMLGFSTLNDAATYSADIDYQIPATNTIITLGYEKLNDNIEGSDKTYLVNPITYALMDQSKYSRYKASVYQAFLDYFVAGVSYETKSVDGDEDFDNRDFRKYGFKFDINGLPTEKTYISISADKWDIDETSTTDDNNRFQYGLQISQGITEQISMWAGTSFSRYEYDYLTDTRKDSVRSYYVGAEYQPNEMFAVMADITREETDFYDDIDSDLSKSYTVELWANVSF
ncbi:hypothetical protein [Denitrovibrio acetiphilus]|nr:hypothetical protein [Denitrovibrio acetiphilus]